MQGAADVHSLTILYLGGMLAMSIISPIVGIISQILAVLLIQKVQAWNAARKAKQDAKPDNRTSDAKILP